MPYGELVASGAGCEAWCRHLVHMTQTHPVCPCSVAVQILGPVGSAPAPPATKHPKALVSSDESYPLNPMQAIIAATQRQVIADAVNGFWGRVWMRGLLFAQEAGHHVELQDYNAPGYFLLHGVPCLTVLHMLFVTSPPPALHLPDDAGAARPCAVERAYHAGHRGHTHHK